MHVHLVPIEVCDVGSAVADVEPKDLLGHDNFPVIHDGDAVQQGLTVKEDNVAILHVALHHKAREEPISGAVAVAVGEVLHQAVGQTEAVGARVDFRTVANLGLETVQSVPTGHLRKGHDHSHVARYANAVLSEVGVSPGVCH